MDHEIFFRTALLILAICIYLVRAVYRRTKPRWRAHDGSGELAVRITPLIWALSITAYILGFNFFQFSFPLSIRVMGVMLVALCLPLKWWIHKTLGEHFTSRLQLSEDHELITSGPYKWIRHPMYSTLFVCILGVSLATAEATVIVTGIAIIIAILFRLKKEEAMLASHFETYSTYKERTGALLPKINF